MRRAGAVMLVVGLMATGCSSTAQDPDRTLHVYAAASLQEPLEELAATFEGEHPGVAVQLVLTGSADAVAQIRAGAPADVVATADTTTMGTLVDADLVTTTPRTFATNTLQLIADAAAGAQTDDGWGAISEGGDLVVCAPVVPCGASTVALAEQEDVELRPVSEEQSVTDVLAKVTSGAADFGIVYRTDVLRAGGGVRGIDLPGAEKVVNEYPIAQVAEGDEPSLAAEFVELVLSDGGQVLLDSAGFGTP
ncbi:molybdate ABC transporter substrate-binding protein [Nocardioides gilvus]|uniref:molybdate ABC transporter substrate-binding protein n=1 Tax=Nocardioides gilvus TaxID=1735589 RepID=UPI000D7400AC|nr:molybdate ABC transporter substrate-binding protein [Nocardioides gilvus]